MKFIKPDFLKHSGMFAGRTSTSILGRLFEAFETRLANSRAPMRLDI
jgi:hypothetical protein